MDFSQNNILSNSNNGFGLQANLFNKKPGGINFGLKTNNNTGAFYAKKGEPMYKEEMDADEDGIVSFEEFKDYCVGNGISPKEMVKMVQLANSYRAMQAQKKAEKEIKQTQSKNENNETDNEFVYAKRGDSKYEEVMDTNNDDKVSYKEYIEYCKEHSRTREQKFDTKIQETKNSEFRTLNLGKAMNSYSQINPESEKSFIDEEG